MLNEMTEDLKETIVMDALIVRRYYFEDRRTSQYIIKLVRALDNYRKRDNKGRFVKGA